MAQCAREAEQHSNGVVGGVLFRGLRFGTVRFSAVPFGTVRFSAARLGGGHPLGPDELSQHGVAHPDGVLVVLQHRTQGGRGSFSVQRSGAQQVQRLGPIQ
jgi:hypothetical protein